MTAASVRPTACVVHRQPVSAKMPLAALAECISRKRGPAILGANASVPDFSVFCAEPIDRFVFHAGGDDPFSKLQQALSRYTAKPPKALFGGGWIGYFGYELGRYIERLPGRATDDLGMPLIHLAFYDKAILYDHARGQWILTALEFDGGRDALKARFRILNQWLGEAAAVPAASSAPVFRPDTVSAVEYRSAVSRADYLNAFEKIRRYIYDGEVYQVNFSRRIECDFHARPIDLFHGQNACNPSPWAAYLAADDWAVVSASPELFLQIDADRIRTRPIKGTRPRAAGPDAEKRNRIAFTDLVQSEKEQAELAMIVDIERNDLARVCLPGTRQVSCPREIEAFATVYHAVATVEGRLPRANDPLLFCQILRATFPGGSITGAPKIRAMEIIDQLEPTARGVYTGAIGRIDPAGSVRLNIAIRTALIKNSRAYVQVGGGIVADSDPRAEWDETTDKARALLDGLAALRQSAGARVDTPGS